ncbi:MAG: hypothetical protein ABIM62_05365 [candidate division WOR-3 bacterium]
MSNKKAIFLLFLFLIFLYIFKNFLSLKYLIIGFSLFAIIIFAIYWKKSLIFLLYWILIEGAFRKWIFPFMQKELFMLKFLILFSIYAGYLIDKKIKNENILPSSPLNLLIISYIIFGFSQIFNPKLPNIFVGIIGFVVEFSFIPLIYIVREVFDEKEKLYKFLKIYLYSSLPFMILGIIQYNLPPTHILNYYAHGGLPEAFAGKGIRVTSTFPYITGYATYLNLISMILLYIITNFELKLYEKIYTYILIFLVFLSLFLTGSRGPFGFTLYIYIFYLLTISIQGYYDYKEIFKLISVFSLIALFIFLIPFGKKAYNNFMQRMGEKGEEDIRWRIKITYLEPFEFSEYAGILGYGTGSAYQGVVQFVENEEAWADMPRAFEPEPGRLILEYGILGFILIFILRWSIILGFFKNFLSLQDLKLKYLSLLIFLYLIPSGIMLSQLNFDTQKNLFFWFFSGFLFLFDKFEKKKINITKYEVER